MRIITIVAAAALLLTSGAAFAQYTGSAWTASFALANSGPFTGGGTYNATGLFIADTGFATFNSGIALGGGGAGTVGFILQVDVFVGATNYLQSTGIGVMRAADGKGAEIVGTAAGNQGMSVNDKSWFNSTKTKSWGLAVGQWTTVQLDYGYTTAGKFSAYYTACPGNGAGWTAGTWETIWALGDTHPSDVFPTIRLGKQNNDLSGTAWAQPTFANLKLLTVGNVVPEPSSMIAMAAGLIGFAGLLRKK